MSEGTHELAFLNKATSHLLHVFARYLSRILAIVVDILGGAQGPENGHLLYAAVRATLDNPARRSSRREGGPMEVGMVTKEPSGHLQGVCKQKQENRAELRVFGIIRKIRGWNASDRPFAMQAS